MFDKLKYEKIKIPNEIQAMIDNRSKFRELGDFDQADAIRQDIEDMGYIVEDTDNGSILKKNNFTPVK